ncbi:sigma-70 family RNA polymerase sigma factor [bacterium]|nr:sigma-70 family RNA polymerase sigma factor [bacterium]
MTNIESHLLKHLTEFLAFARHRVGNPELAADVVQESLLKALRSQNQLVDEGSSRAWFYRILRHTIIDLQHRRQTEHHTTAQLAVELESANDSETDRVVCECLRHLLPTMNPGYARLIESIDLNGATPDEIANEFSTSRNNVNVRLHRARQQLKQRLEDTCRVCATHGCLDCDCEPATMEKGF